MPSLPSYQLSLSSSILHFDMPSTILSSEVERTEEGDLDNEGSSNTCIHRLSHGRWQIYSEDETRSKAVRANLRNLAIYHMSKSNPEHKLTDRTMVITKDEGLHVDTFPGIARVRHPTSIVDTNSKPSSFSVIAFNTDDKYGSSQHRNYTLILEQGASITYRLNRLQISSGVSLQGPLGSISRATVDNGGVSNTAEIAEEWPACEWLGIRGFEIKGETHWLYDQAPELDYDLGPRRHVSEREAQQRRVDLATYLRLEPIWRRRSNGCMFEPVPNEYTGDTWRFFCIDTCV